MRASLGLLGGVFCGLVGCGGAAGAEPIDAMVVEIDGANSATDAGLPSIDDAFAFCASAGAGMVYQGDPGNYRALLDQLGPGDTLTLAAGTYDMGLPLHGMHGEDGNCIVIEGPEAGAAVFTGSSSRNTVSLRDSSYIVVRNLELDGAGELGDAVKAEGDASYAHHIVLENLHLHGHAANQQVVGISTKCPAWSWVIRGNRIDTAGTGMYLGNSDGSAPFVAGLIEHNVVVDTTGYNVQIKHQTDRPALPGMPASARTIVRHNVFSKASGGATGDDARPNVLVGHFPLSGAGAGDHYLIYGNFFYQNPTEALFQGEGNLALYSNVLVNDGGSAINVQPHNDVPRAVEIVFNTVLASDDGIRVSGGDAGYRQLVAGNAVFAAAAITGGEQTANLTSDRASAANYLTNPDGVVSGTTNRLDVHPLAGMLMGETVDTAAIEAYAAWQLDFDGRPRATEYRGAYAGPADAGAWQLALSRKP